MPRYDDDDDRPTRSRPRRHPDSDGGGEAAAAVFGVFALLALVAASVMVLFALGLPAPQGAVWAGLTCFAGIVARILQAAAYHAGR